MNEQKEKGLYVHRKLLNGGSFHQWAIDNNVPNPIQPEEMHVTQVYSKKPVKLMPDHQVSMLQLNKPNMHLETFPSQDNKRALVIRFDDKYFHDRFLQAKAAGASYDYGEYKPHVTISYDVDDFDYTKLKPPELPMIFGSEEHSPLDEDWKPK